ncbi:hypothetical protein ABPG72_020139 [Tetrahymena utriculariae]
MEKTTQTMECYIMMKLILPHLSFSHFQRLTQVLQGDIPYLSELIQLHQLSAFKDKNLLPTLISLLRLIEHPQDYDRSTFHQITESIKTGDGEDKIIIIQQRKV